MPATLHGAAALVTLFLADGVRKRKIRQDNSGICSDPAAAIVHTMNCIKNGDGACADAGYSRNGWEMIHNSKEVTTSVFPAEHQWSTAMRYATFTSDINFQENIGDNRAEIRYVDYVKMTDGSNLGLAASTAYPFSATFKQHEHAIVTVDGDCKIVRWDQYGDNKEQSDVETAMTTLARRAGFVSLSHSVPFTRSEAETKGDLAEEPSSSDSDVEPSYGCADPLAAVIKTMDCIRDKNTTCANEMYAWHRFDKYNNGVNAGVMLFPFDIYWKMALRFSTLTLDFDYSRNIKPDFRGARASVRYVETIEMSDGSDFNLAPRNTYPFNQTMYQYEHALVTVDERCKIARWDQYGDVAEQEAVDKATADMMADQGVKCDLGLAAPWNCK